MSVQQLLKSIDPDRSMTKEQLAARIYGDEDEDQWFKTYYKLVVAKEDLGLSLNDYCVTIESFVMLTLIDGPRWVCKSGAARTPLPDVTVSMKCCCPVNAKHAACKHVTLWTLFNDQSVRIPEIYDQRMIQLRKKRDSKMHKTKSAEEKSLHCLTVSGPGKQYKGPTVRVRLNMLCAILLYLMCFLTGTSSVGNGERFRRRFCISCEGEANALRACSWFSQERHCAPSC